MTLNKSNMSLEKVIRRPKAAANYKMEPVITDTPCDLLVWGDTENIGQRTDKLESYRMQAHFSVRLKDGKYKRLE